MNKRVFVDTNVFLLLIIGTASRQFITRHRRLRKYDVAAFDLLRRLIVRCGQPAVTPHIIAEASNLLGKLSDGRHNIQIGHTFKSMIGSLIEIFKPAAEIASHPDLARLGIADSGLLSLSAGDPANSVILTDDLDLYLAASKAGLQVINFTYERNLG